MSLTFPTGFKFSYSGDCRPSLNFAKIGKGSTVLLHEATFDDELRGDAEAKKHSTTSEAIGVGVAMGARRVILTHFSQRYQKIPVMDNLGLMHVKLENTDENAESDIPVPDNQSSDPVPEALPEDVVVQDTATVDADVLSKSTSEEQGSEHLDEPEAQATDLWANLKRRRLAARDASQRSSQSESEVVIAPAVAKDMKICVAFDYMRIKVKEIAHMEKFTPALLELYQQDDAVEEEAEKGSNAVEKKNKREDKSDDESSKGNKKKSNEEINRGKSKKQIRRELREKKQSQEGQSEGKGNAGAGNTASSNASVSPVPMEGKETWKCIFDYRNEQRDERLARKRLRKINLQLAILKDNGTTDSKDLKRIYKITRISIAHTTFAITGQVSEFLKVLGQQAPLGQQRMLDIALHGTTMRKRRVDKVIEKQLRDIQDAKRVKEVGKKRKEQRMMDAAIGHEVWLIQNKLTSQTSSTNESAPINESVGKALMSTVNAAPASQGAEKVIAGKGLNESQPWEPMQDRRTTSTSHRFLTGLEHQISESFQEHKSEAPIVRKQSTQPPITSESGSFLGREVIGDLPPQPDTGQLDLVHQAVSDDLPKTSITSLQPVVGGLEARYRPAGDKDTLIPIHMFSRTLTASTQQSIMNRANAHYRPASDTNTMIPMNKVAQYLSVRAAKSDIKPPGLPPSAKGRTGKPASPVAATRRRKGFPRRVRSQARTKPRPKTVEHLSWDMMLADVAKEVEVDLREAGRGP